GDERHRIGRREPAILVTRAVHLGTPHRVDRALDGGLCRALLAERAVAAHRGAVDGHDDRHALRVRAPERLHAGRGEVARALRVEVLALADADDDHAWLAVARGDAVGAPRAALGLRDAIDRGLHA